MAIISSTKTITSSDGSGFTITTELDTATGKKFTTVNNLQGALITSGTPEKVNNLMGSIAKSSASPGAKALAAETTNVIGEQSESLTSQYQQQVPPPSTEPTTPAQLAAQNAASQGSTGENKANDDGTVSSAAELGSNNPTSSTNPDAGSEGDKTSNDRAGTTVAGKQGVNVASDVGTGGAGLPGARLYNPLSKFSSYTYQLTLYMVTPDALNAFNASGRKQIPNKTLAAQGGGGFYLLAQSGGINNTLSERAPGFDLDFYIDDLKLQTAFGFAETGSPVVTNDITFSIIEPYGFSFPTRLHRASLALAQQSKLPGYNKMGVNPTRQPMMLAVRFYGYDSTGKPYTSTNFPDQSGSTSSDGQSVFEKFYDIEIKELKFKLDGKATRYTVVASPQSERVVFGMKRGVIKNPVTVKGSTVQEMMDGTNGLFTQLNAENQKEVTSTPKKREIADVYKVKFIPEGSRIPNSKMKSPADLDKTRLPLNSAKKTSDSTDATARNTEPNMNIQMYSVPSGEPIVKHINNIISQSSYLEDALKLIYGTTDEEGEEDVTKDTNITVKWFNIQPQVKCLGFDTIINDFAYEITYLIQPYDTPYARSAYITRPTPYYGPTKRYDYWFTGKNSEVISYEQQFDNLFNTIALDPKASGIVTTDVPIMTNTPQPADRTGRFDLGKEAQNSYTTSLYTAEDPTKIKFKILGDPDYLVQPPGTGDTYNKFYRADGYTINQTSGQVFIEINFREPVDYDSNTGLLSINDGITFFNKSPLTPVVKGGGVSYLVKNVVHTFSSGKFQQDLELALNPFTKKQQAEASERPNGQAVTPNSDVRNSQTSPDDPTQNSVDNKRSNLQGLIPVPELSITKAQELAADRAAGLATENSIQTSTPNPIVGQTVADDDNDPYRGV